REILVHRDHDGWEFDEIASHYQISEANARMIVSRSRKTIREIYLKRQKL
ncbi:MAG: sigma-70 family RNA polymerase sigma factor, partial [Muribaculaceae bacterium]|nr:sigma-70 family RNA polymerase sigma factor [Muribaculaceae bacterium]